METKCEITKFFSTGQYKQCDNLFILSHQGGKREDAENWIFFTNFVN